MTRPPHSEPATGPSCPQSPREPQTYDYRQRYWGHNYEFITLAEGHRTARLVIWGTPCHAGDYLILENHSPDGTRYQVTAVEQMTSPPDMAFLDVEVAPRRDEP